MKKIIKSVILIAMVSFVSANVFAAKKPKEKKPKGGAGGAQYQYTKPGWKSVKIGGGGMIPGIIFNTSKKGVAYVRTDMGGAYRYIPESQSWMPLTDFAGVEDYGKLGICSIATDPVEPNRLVIAAGTYTNDWDGPMHMLVSEDYGDNFIEVKVKDRNGKEIHAGGNMPGRGCGERLAIDPNDNRIIYYGSNGDGLYRSTDYGHSWSEVVSFPTKGNVYDEGFSTWSHFDHYFGILWVIFDPESGTKGSATQNIYVGVADTRDTIFESTDGGNTWHALEGQPDIGQDLTSQSNEYAAKWSKYPANYSAAKAKNRAMSKHAHMTGDVCECEKYYPITGVYSPKGELLVVYNHGFGPYSSSFWGGAIWKYNFKSKEWTDISLPKHDADPSRVTLDRGAGSIAVDWQNPDTYVACTLNEWWPDEVIYRSTDGGKTWVPIWQMSGWPDRIDRFTQDISEAKWLTFGNETELPVRSPKLGWCMADIEIDPFDSNVMMYGTGATLYGCRNLTDWDKNKKVKITVASAGIEECAILDLMCPPIKGIQVVSGMGDNGGFVHNDLTKSPDIITNPWIAGVSCLDFAEEDPYMMIRMGDGKMMYTENGGDTWKGTPTYVDDANTGWGGTAALSASGSTIVWGPSNKVAHWSSDFGKKWTLCKGLPEGAKVISDRKNNKKFYAYGDGKFYASEDEGRTFAMVCDNWKQGAGDIDASDFCASLVEGDLWFAAGKAGMYHTKDGGKTWTALPGFDRAMIVGLGAPKDKGGYQAVYTNSQLNGKYGIYRSDDAGETWIRINDDKNQFGAANSTITGHPTIYGRVFIGANGRGIMYRDLND